MPEVRSSLKEAFLKERTPRDLGAIEGHHSLLAEELGLVAEELPRDLARNKIGVAVEDGWNARPRLSEIQVRYPAGLDIEGAFKGATQETHSPLKIGIRQLDPSLENTFFKADLPIDLCISTF